MTPAEKAKRAHALYYDVPMKRDLCNMMAQRESDLETLTEVVVEFYRTLCKFISRDSADKIAKELKSMGVDVLHGAQDG